jgi:hypothetical protein
MIQIYAYILKNANRRVYKWRHYFNLTEKIINGGIYFHIYKKIKRYLKRPKNYSSFLRRKTGYEKYIRLSI